jgi:ribosomal protein S17E
MAVGSLIIELAANVARLSEDMEKAKQVVESNLEQINSFVEKTKFAFASLGVGLTFEHIREGIDQVIESSAGLVNVAAKTGATVEGLSALNTVAKITGTSSETLDMGLIKLDKSLAALEAGTPKTIAAFASLGLSAKDFAGLSSDEAFKKVADAMARYKDGVEKTAAAQLIFGRAGAELIPVLRDVAEGGDLVTKVTKEEAIAAEEYEKNVRRLHAAQEDLHRIIGTAIVPVLNAFTKAMLDAYTAADGMNAEAKRLKENGHIREWAEEAARVVGFVVDAFDGVRRIVEITGLAIGAVSAALVARAHLDFEGSRAIMSAFAADADAILNKELFSSRLEKQIAAARQAATGTVETPKLTMPTPAASPIGEDKLILDEQLKRLQAFIASENDALKQRDEQLKRYYDADQLSIGQYFEGLRIAQQGHLIAVSDAYGKEIAAINDYILKSEDEKTKVAGRIQLDRVRAEAARAVQTEEAALARISDENAKATEAYGKKIDELNVKYLTMRGYLAAAAQAQVDLADKQTRLRFGMEPGGADALTKLTAIEKETIDQAGLNQLKNEASLIESRLATQTGYVNLAVQTGQIGELEGLARTDAARQAQIAQLERIADEYLRIARTAQDDGKTLAAAEAFKLKIDQLAASTDELAKKFNDMFEVSFANNFAKVIDGTESISKAFSNMVNSIIADLSKMAAQDIAKQIFGAGGASGGGVGGAIAGLFKGGSPDTSAGPPASMAGGGGWLSAASSILGAIFAGAKQGGGYVSSGSAYLVGEKGPELFSPGTSGTIIPAGSFGGSTTVNVHMPPGVPQTRESMMLAGAAAARAISVAHARNN